MKRLAYIFVLIIAATGCSTIKIIECPPDNEPVVLYRNLDKAFAFYYSDYEVSLGTFFANLAHLGSVFLNVQKRTTLLTEKLNQENIALASMLKATLFMSQQAPCDTVSRREFVSVLKMIIDKVGMLKIMSEEASQLLMAPNNSDAVESKINEWLGLYATDVMDRAMAIEQFSAMKGEFEKLERQVGGIASRSTRFMVGELFFDSGSAEVNAWGRNYLRNIGELLKSYTDMEVIVVGHADSMRIHPKYRKYKDNMQLSVARAESVAHFVVNDVGIDSSRVHVAGLSKYYPVTMNRTDQEMARNRRVEIWLVQKKDLPFLPTDVHYIRE